jgi:N-acetylmuramic acid 6-phosphate (MurNAc-6-P) etherase
MLAHLTGMGEVEIETALVRANGNVKLAVLLLKGCTLETAQALLQRTGGKLRAAIALAMLPHD